MIQHSTSSNLGLIRRVDFTAPDTYILVGLVKPGLTAMTSFSSSMGRCLLLASLSAAVADLATSEAPAVSCAANRQTCRLLTEILAGACVLGCTLPVVTALR